MLKRSGLIAFIVTFLLAPFAIVAHADMHEGSTDDTAVMSLVINEVMASNDDTIEDPQGDDDDWVEIYNPTETDVDMRGLYLSDDPFDEPTKYRIPGSLIVPANGYILIWLDNDEEDGPDHASFAIKNGESLALITSDGSRFIHRVTVTGLDEDESAGLLPNGDKTGGNFVRLSVPTPLARNEAQPADSGDTVPGTCIVDVPVFTQDAAPTNGTLLFKVRFGEENRVEGATTMRWNVSEGEQIDNAPAPMPRPSWARVWWRPAGDNTWYLLPSQYWQGDGTAGSEYGLECNADDIPSYHTAFADAIPEDDVPEFDP